jgi:hypothetical protein
MKQGQGCEKMRDQGVHASIWQQQETQSVEAVTIDKGAERKHNDQQGWTTSARNLKHNEQRENRQNRTSHSQQKGTMRTTVHSIKGARLWKL